MSKLIVTEYVTVDGVMEAPGGEPGHPHTGWTFDYHTPEQEQFKFDEIVEAESQLVGRVTYESFAEAWPSVEGEFGDRMNAMPKYVVSSTLPEATWQNTTVLRSLDEVAALKERSRGPILVPGSRTLVHALLRAGLVDELRLLIFPVILGSGGRVFGESPDKTPLRLSDRQEFGDGVVLHTYALGA